MPRWDFRRWAVGGRLAWSSAAGPSVEEEEVDGEDGRRSRREDREKE